MNIFNTSDVFGISRTLPTNYVRRVGVDNLLIEALSRNKHIVIYGSSKQGKTCLRKRNINDDDCIVISCVDNLSIGQLNAALLKKSGYEVNASTKVTASGKMKAIASLKAAILGSKISGELEGQVSKERLFQPFQLDLEDPNDIIEALKKVKFNKYIVLEDFHYLDLSTQRAFSYQLKAFHENSEYLFIIVGVWLEENRLVSLNGDLVGRVIAINTDAWSMDDLQQVVKNGEKLLNVKLPENFKNILVENSCGSVSAVQEVCLNYCKSLGIHQTQMKEVYIESVPNLFFDLIIKFGDLQAARNLSFLMNCSVTEEEEEYPEMIRYILGSIVQSTTKELLSGITCGAMREKIKLMNPLFDKINLITIIRTLKILNSLQDKHFVQPLIVDYSDTDAKLFIVDKSFVIWLQQQRHDELLRTLQLA